MDDSRPPDRRAQDRERTVTNLILLAIFAVIVGISIWLTSALLDARRADECIGTGRRNCTPIEVPQR
jgi:hypothetical protein